MLARVPSIAIATGSIRTSVRLMTAYSASSQRQVTERRAEQDRPEEHEGDAVEHVPHLFAELVDVAGVAPEREPEGHARDERADEA